MSKPVRGAPPIPDYDILGYVGGGSYGEVWLGRSLTGTLRAIKVVWREDFDYEKTFEREFQGIREFEPVSRSHKNLVHVFHVGWLAEHGLYYYVMEIADDQVRGWDIDPGSYQPRTLTSDLETVSRIALPICLKGGIKMAEALKHLHNFGLTHRDVKPSNVIFVHGEPKLADIGLVAVVGERGYVGTEGYVPPEGPGTPGADIFSLGKVMYELSTGMDRHEFPTVPSFSKKEDLIAWRPLNAILCKACDPNPAKRYSHAADLERDLRRVLARMEAPRLYTARRFRNFLLGSALTGAALSAVLDHNNLLASVSAPLPYAWEEDIPVRQGPFGVAGLEEGKTWINSLDMVFRMKDDRYQSERPVDITAFSEYLREDRQPFSGEIFNIKSVDGDIHAVVAPAADAQLFAEWLTKREQNSGLLTQDQIYRVEAIQEFEGNQSPPVSPAGSLNIGFLLVLDQRPTGSVVVETEPQGAVVYAEDGSNLGKTPLLLEKQPTGMTQYSIELQGFQRVEVKGEVTVDQSLIISRALSPSRSVVFGQAWTNSLGMKFVPLSDILVGTDETTETAMNLWKKETVGKLTEALRDPSADSNLPAANVSRDEAARFCEWLTLRERRRGLLDEAHEYRLPTDTEWSRMADLPPERGETPAEKSGNIRGIYPWFFSWPPPAGAGNYADESARGLLPEVLEDYDDHFPRLAPVGTFPANYLSLHDLGGNVREWVSDAYDGPETRKKDLGVLRGGGWRDHVRESLFSSHRFALPANSKEPDSGFRMVLSPKGVTLAE